MNRPRPRKARKIIIRVLVFLLLGAIVNVAGASTTSSDRQALDVRNLQWAANAYFGAVGQYPVNDPSGTWFQKIVAGGYLPPEHLRCGITKDGTLPVDLFGQPLVYEVLDSNVSGAAVVRSIGRDGIDDHGAGDDFDSRYGANIGFWNKSNWPEFFAFIGAGWILGFAGAWLVWFKSRRILRACAVGLLIGGALVGVLTLLLFNASAFMRSSASRLPQWGEAIADYSILGVPAGSVVLIVGRLRHKARERRIQRGLCPACAYPVGSSPVCTECGQPVTVRSAAPAPPSRSAACDDFPG